MRKQELLNLRARLPRESREAFALLERAGWIEPGLSRRMRAMVGFRNIAVHDYRKLRLEVVRGILEKPAGVRLCGACV